MSNRSRTLALPLCAALALACAGDAGVGPYQSVSVSVQHILTTIDVTPTGSILRPGDRQQLTIAARDQFGHVMATGTAAKLTYASTAPEIAVVSADGLVTAVAPGIAWITVSVRVGDLTIMGSMTARVNSDTATNVTVTANPNRSWSPYMIRVKAGSTVTWAIPPGVQLGTIWLNVWDANAEELKFVDGFATRTFSTPGSFYYGTGGGLMWDEEGGVIEVY